MKHIDKETWKLLRNAIKQYISDNLRGETEKELYLSMRRIFRGLYGKKKGIWSVPYPDGTFLVREWLRSARRDFVAEYLIVWKYLRIEGTPMILDRGNSKYRVNPDASITKYLLKID